MATTLDLAEHQHRGGVTTITHRAARIGVALATTCAASVTVWALAAAESSELPTTAGALRPDSPGEPLVAAASAPLPVGHGAREAIGGASPNLVLGGFVGRVTDGNAQPVGGCRVKLCTLVQSTSDESLTDADGRFRFTDVSPNGVHFVLADANGPQPTLALATPAPRLGEIRDLGVLVLAAGGTVMGHVSDDAGRPLADTEVAVRHLPDAILWPLPTAAAFETAWLFLEQRGARAVIPMPARTRAGVDMLTNRVTRTNAAGAFRVAGLPEGTHALRLSRADAEPLVRSGLAVRSGTVTDLGMLRVRATPPIHGSVVDALGRPAAGAEVMWAQDDASAPLAVAVGATRCDARGRFASNARGFGPWLFAVRRSPHDAWLIVDGEPASEGWRLRLPACHTITVRVHPPAGIAHDTLCCELSAGATDDQLLPVHTRTGKLAADGKLRFGDLPVGRYVLDASIDGRRLPRVWFDLDGDREVDCHAGTTHAIPITVVDERGRVVSGARVEVTSLADTAVPTIRAVRTTDQAGATRVDWHEGERLNVVISHAIGVAEAGIDGPAPIHTVLRSAARIEGRCPTAHPPARFVLARREPSLDRPAAPGIPRVAAIGIQGDFVLDDLAPGAWRLDFSAASDPAALLADLLFPDGGTTAGAIVELAPGMCVRWPHR